MIAAGTEEAIEVTGVAAGVRILAAVVRPLAVSVGHRVDLAAAKAGHRVDLAAAKAGHQVDLVVVSVGHRVDLAAAVVSVGHPAEVAATARADLDR